MRASETVSEASPGSTASQTGVPTQVVQQVQGTQQVGHAPPPGWTEAVAVATLLPPLPVLLLEPSAHLFLSRCSLLKKKSLPLHPAFPPPRPGFPGETNPVQVLPPFPTAATGPDKRAGQAGPRVTPPAHQHPGAPAGKRPASGPTPALRASPGRRTNPRSLLGSARTSLEDAGPTLRWPVRLYQSGPIR